MTATFSAIASFSGPGEAGGLSNPSRRRQGTGTVGTHSPASTPPATGRTGPVAADPITLAVIQAGWTSAAEEMFAVLRKTAMSPIIHEVLDVGTGVTDGDGNLVGSGAGIPSFVGVLDKAVRRILEIHDSSGPGGERDGDVFITNDPAYGGVTHLSDVVVAEPVFHAGVRIAWVASIGHWSDIGGMTPGSMSVAAREIYQEGVRLPAVRLFDAGRPVTPVFDIIAANSRLPAFASGDLWAQIAAGRRAAAQLRQMAATYGLDAYNAALDALFDRSERQARAGLRALPRGDYAIEEEQDDGAIWRARITIGAEAFRVDLRDNPTQRTAPHNTSRDGAVIASQMLFKALTGPSLPTTQASFRPLDVITEPGTVFHAEDPAPHGFYFETRIRLYDMLWRCLARAFPERLPAGHFGTIGGTVVAGVHPETGRRYTMVEPQMGGWGATADRDGLDCMYSTSHGDTFNCPVEICEARYGLDVAWKRMNSRSAGGAGQGRHSGGRGLTICYRPRGQATVAVGFSRHRLPVWGLAGGHDGGTNGLTVIRSNGDREDYGFASDLVVAAGDSLVIRTANGGGWGSPSNGAG